MRFAAVHKASSYLVALCAFASVALSGELDLATLALGTIGFVASWWFEPPRVRPERWTPVLTVAALAAFAFAVMTVLAGVNVILAGARFLVVLLVVRLFARKSSRDVQQLYLLSFLLLVTGTAINTGVSFAVCFLGFVVAATWALILFHLRRDMEDNFLLKHADDASSERVQVERILSSRRIVGPSFLASTSAVSVGIFLGAIALFIFFPRVGFGLFFQHSRSGVNVSGFSDRVKLGGHGLIRDDDTVVMRVYIDGHPEWRGADAPPLHYRGVAFNHYEKGLWSRSPNLMPTAGRGGSSADTVYPALDGRRRKPDERRARADRALHQSIYIEPLDTDVLFGASTPLRFKVEPIGVGENQQRVGLYAGDEVRMDRRQGIHYDVWSDPSTPRAEDLAAAPDADPARFADYLEVPPEMPERVHQLALDITAGAKGPYEKTQKIYDWLHRGFSYTLELETDDTYEPLDYFLFERKKGHCEYFSSAMAILLREVGVPTRNVNGFLGGEWNEYGGYFAVRGADAHSWVEVWYDGAGWVTWDPTPSAELGREGGFLAKLRRLFDTLKLKWFKWVIEYDLSSQLSLFGKMKSALSLGGGGKLSAKAAGRWLRAHRGAIAVVLILLVLGAALWTILKRRRAPEPVKRARRLRRDPVVHLWLRTAHLVARRAAPRKAGDTPREHARALARAGSPAAAPYAELTELYYRARFERDDAPDAAEVERARALAASVKAALAARRP